MDFLLEPQQLFIHTPHVEEWRFSTHPVEAYFAKLYSTGILSTFHNPCGKVGKPPQAIRAEPGLLLLDHWVPLGIVTAFYIAPKYYTV